MTDRDRLTEAREAMIQRQLAACRGDAAPDPEPAAEPAPTGDTLKDARQRMIRRDAERSGGVPPREPARRADAADPSDRWAATAKRIADGIRADIASGKLSTWRSDAKPATPAKAASVRSDGGTAVGNVRFAGSRESGSI